MTDVTERQDSSRPRVLVVGMLAVQPLADAMQAQDPGLDVQALEPRCVDLGQFGGVVQCHGPGAARVWPVRPYPYSLFGWALVKRLREVRPQVVFYLGEPNELGAAQTIAVARLLLPGVRVVVWSFENVARRWSSWPGRLRGRLLAHVLRRADAALVGSSGAARLLERQGLPVGRARVAFMGDDETVFQPAARPEAASGLTLLYAGRLVAEKGVDLLLSALAAAPADVRLAVAGTGPDEAALRQLSQRLGLDDRVRWLGQLLQADLSAAMAAADILVLPSRATPVWAEQFGRVLAQALLCGRPVIGSRTGAIPEVVGRSGWLFDDGDAVQLGRLLCRLANDPDEVRRRAATARAFALRRYRHDHFVAQVVAAVRDQLGATRGA
ncbi:MAG: glycosyltransferase [Armatimonadetes bacterium]|nr:glycosyltransferase [Armatimonadota bacterium]